MRIDQALVYSCRMVIRDTFAVNRTTTSADHCNSVRFLWARWFCLVAPILLCKTGVSLRWFETVIKHPSQLAEGRYSGALWRNCDTAGSATPAMDPPVTEFMQI